MKIKRFAFLGAFAVILLLANFLPSSLATTLAATGGLLNASFENGLTNWSIVKESDKVAVVGAEGPSQFTAYVDMGNVTVSPYMGDKMLRLGAPKRLAESQPVGPNTVSQTFTSNCSTLIFAFRLFSWEARGQDQFSFDLKDGSASVGSVTAADGSSPVLIRMPDGTALNFSASPRIWIIDVGRRGQYLDTGWVPVRINGVPVGKSLTLSFSTGGTKDSAHATWAYFDNADTPPVAKFSFSPLQPLEGDIVQLLDGSYDTDPGDRIVSWNWDITWTISSGDVWHSYSNVRNPFFVPPDEDSSYSVSLTVTDTWGISTTITDGEVPLDGFLYYPASDPPNTEFEPLDHKIPALVINNAAPLVNALDVEALPGQTITLIGRFLDPGWTDNHTASWAVSGAITLHPATMTLLEDHAAFLETGIATCQATVNAAPGNYDGTLTITDNDGAASSDNFTIRVVPDTPERREPDNDIPLASDSQLPGDGIYLSYIQSVGDVDLFEVTLPTGELLPAGSEILVTLKGLPADYDLILFSQSPVDIAPFQMSPFQMSPFQMSPFQMSPFQMSPFQMSPFQRSDAQGTPFQMSPFQRSPFQMSPFQMSPFQMSPFQRSPFQMSPFQRSTFDQYPLSDVGYTGLDAADIGGTDISLAELGLGSISADLKPIGFSANRGLENEALLVRSELDGTRFYVAVVGANEAFSATPYQLQIETSRPLDLAGWLAEEGFTYNAPVGGWDNSGLYQDNSTPAVISSVDSPLTLFVTQRERMKGLYGDARWGNLVSTLTGLAQQTAVRGKVISVPIGVYENADLHTDNVAALNKVAETIRTIVRTQLAQNPTIQYVVLVGSDDVIPYYRVPDETIISNERTYLANSFVTPGSPLFYSLLGGWNLTDDYYVDLDPLIPWQGRVLYLPDLAIGRMVETPEEIEASAEAFTTSGGILDARTALVTGYDFFSDGSAALASILGADAALIGDNWTADDLRSKLLSGDYDISAINAHFAHYAAVSALGFTRDLPDIISSEDVTLASGDPLLNTLVMSMGCHAGLNVTDGYSEAADPGMGVNPALDFPQAMAQERAIFVASTGYGLGDDEGIGGTERLMNIFADSLKNDAVPVGQSLMLAKQRYFGSLSTMTVYDEKSSIQFTLYGLPQYRVGGSNVGSSAVQESALSSIAAASLTSADDFLTLSNMNLQRVDTGSGSYFTVDGDAQATAFRPTEPRLVLPLEAGGAIVHGALLQGGQYQDLTDFNPVITRPTDDWEAEVSELQIALPALWPSSIASVNTLEVPGGAIQNLVVTPGQFQPTGFTDSSEVIGIQRLYTTINLELLRSGSDDFEPPVVSSIDLTLSGDVVNIGISASDPSGIARILVLVFHNGQAIPTELTFSQLPQSGYFTLAVNLPGGTNDRLTLQVVDGAGNVAAVDGKGACLSAIAVDAGPDRAFGSYGPVTFTARISDFASLTNNGTSPVFYLWKFGDGTSTSGMLPADYPLDANGDAVFSVQHTYLIPDSDSTGQVTATVKVTDASGGTGTDEVILYRIWDPRGDANSSISGPLPDADLVGGYVANDGTTMTIGLRVNGNVSAQYQYRVTLNIQPIGAVLLKYNDGHLTGLPSLTGELIWNEKEKTYELRLTFNLADLSLKTGDVVWLYFATQAGIQATGSTGFVDRMPDSGSFLYIMQ